MRVTRKRKRKVPVAVMFESFTRFDVPRYDYFREIRVGMARSVVVCGLQRCVAPQ